MLMNDSHTVQEENKDMAACCVCGKRRITGNNVSHANNRTKRVFAPNLQRVKMITDNGGVKRAYVCTRCLRTGLVKKAV